MTDVLKVFGPPGTGKTTRLLAIMEQELARGIPPEQLAFLTFTVAARKEAKDRAISKFGFEPRRLKWFRTLHSVAYELLGVDQGTMVTSEDGLDEFSERTGYEFSKPFRFSDEGLPAFGFSNGDKLLAFDHFRRHRLMSFDTAYKAWPDDTVSRWEAQRFTEAYQAWKAEDGRMDFTDLLERGQSKLPCAVVIVDEAQDLSPLQWKALWAFARGAARVYVAGDDDQAIYEWAGASPAAFIEQKGAIEVLPQSYRCPQLVTDLARQLIQPVHVRQPKEWKSRPVMGVLKYGAMLDQLDVPPDGSVIYLYRNHRYADEVKEYLRAAGQVWSQHGQSSVDPAAARAIILWERVRKGRPLDQDGWELLFKFASLRTLSAEVRAAVRQRAQDGLAGKLPMTAPWFDVLDKLKEDQFYIRKIVQRGGAEALTRVPRISLSTIHGAKGLERDHVILLTDMTGLVKRGFERDPDAERRVWYVGVTRAKETLTLIGINNPLL